MAAGAGGRLWERRIQARVRGPCANGSHLVFLAKTAMKGEGGGDEGEKL